MCILRISKDWVSNIFETNKGYAIIKNISVSRKLQFKAIQLKAMPFSCRYAIKIFYSIIMR